MDHPRLPYLQMESQRSFSFNFGSGQDQRFRLGDTVDRVGIIETAEVIYPRFTGASLEARRQSTKNLPAGNSTSAIFGTSDLNLAQTFVSDNVTRDNGTNRPLLVLPYTGVPSVYRVRLRINYSSNLATGLITTELDMLDSNGSPFTRTVLDTRRPANSVKVVTIDYTGPISQVTRVRVTNGTAGLIFLPIQSSFSYTAIVVTYLGTL